jgi:hypothetical protein
MATKIMSVQSNGFPDAALVVTRNQDAIHFIQSGVNAPSTVTVPSGLFQGGITTCIVDPNATGTNLYSVVGADGNYSVNLPPTPKAVQGTGTIQVSG